MMVSDETPQTKMIEFFVKDNREALYKALQTFGVSE